MERCAKNSVKMFREVSNICCVQSATVISPVTFKSFLKTINAFLYWIGICVIRLLKVLRFLRETKKMKDQVSIYLNYFHKNKVKRRL